jgi:hypothetical protein
MKEALAISRNIIDKTIFTFYFNSSRVSYDNDLPLPVLVPMKTSFPSAKAMKLSLG